MRDAFVRVLTEEMERNDRIVLITGDLGFGVLRPLWERFPDRMVNAGIAEQGMVSMAAGLAATGRTVIVYSIGNFPTLRPLEQIRNDCAYHRADVKIVCVGGGFVYGSLGMSHHATEDMSVMRAIPDVCCFTPGDPAETEAVTRAMLRIPGTCYLRLGRGNEPKVHPAPVEGWTIPKALTLREGSDIALLSAGGILTQAMDAAERLAEYYEVTVYTTCALDYTTWANHYPAGEETINGVRVKRWPVRKERKQERFDRKRTAALLEAHGVRECKLVICGYEFYEAAKNERRGVIDIIDSSRVPLIGAVPYDRTLMLSNERGVKAPEESDASMAFLNIACRLCGERVRLFDGISNVKRRKIL